MNPEPNFLKLIPELHRVYVEQIGQPISLNSGREMTWLAWLQFRKEPAPFCEADLRLVIAHIWRGIKDKTRNEGALRFSNLIGMPDYFEEQLAMALQGGRKPKVEPNRQAALESTGRTGGPGDNTGKPAGVLPDHKWVPASEVAQEALRKLKESL